MFEIPTLSALLPPAAIVTLGTSAPAAQDGHSQAQQQEGLHPCKVRERLEVGRLEQPYIGAGPLFWEFRKSGLSKNVLLECSVISQNYCYR